MSDNQQRDSKAARPAPPEAGVSFNFQMTDPFGALVGVASGALVYVGMRRAPGKRYPAQAWRKA